ncbi:peptidyl-proline hydroxylation to 4-hydroxy-L-proline [Pristimantis euphronides]
MPAMPLMSTALERLALEHIAPRLLSCGYCYLDHVLGEELGAQVLEQVRRLHREGALRDGQLTGRLREVSRRQLRGDQIAWVAGTEAGCEAIGRLLSVIDRLVVLCGQRLEQCYVQERSKAMVACYPGNGAGYVRHVDNPTGDGRCITCIYYLNKNWDAKVHGGVLRIFPGGGSRVADVEPLLTGCFSFGPTGATPMRCSRPMPPGTR